MKINTRNLLVIIVSVVVGSLILSLPTVAAPIEPYPTAPLCPTHDDRAYHGLWDPDRGCHYSHTHGDNPHELDVLLGTHIYDDFGGEISYPWQTYSSAGTENALKHEGYIWVVRQDLPCVAPGTAGCVTDFRALVHFHQDGHDTPIRYHSFFFQGRGCKSGVCGVWQMGGWQDSGDLLVNGQTVIDVPGNGNCHKQHSSTSGMAVWYPCFRYGEQGIQGFGRVSLAIHNEWDYTNPANPGDYLDTICYGNPRCQNNGSFVRPHLISIDIPGNPVEDLLDPDNNNIIESFDGFSTNHGVIDPTCTQVSAVCVPLKFENISVRYSYTYQDTDPGRSYDIWFCGTVVCQYNSPGRRTSNWIQPHH